MPFCRPTNSVKALKAAWKHFSKKYAGQTSRLVWRRAVPATAVNGTCPRRTGRWQVSAGVSSRLNSRAASKRSTTQHHTSVITAIHHRSFQNDDRNSTKSTAYAAVLITTNIPTKKCLSFDKCKLPSCDFQVCGWLLFNSTKKYLFVSDMHTTYKNIFSPAWFSTKSRWGLPEESSTGRFVEMDYAPDSQPLYGYYTGQP